MTGVIPETATPRLWSDSVSPNFTADRAGYYGFVTYTVFAASVPS